MPIYCSQVVRLLPHAGAGVLGPRRESDSL